MENYPRLANVMDGISFMPPKNEQCTRFGLKIEQKEVSRIEK